MSYGRFDDDCNLYIYQSANNGFWVVHATDDESYSEYKTYEELHAAVVAAKARGLLVPDRVFERIEREMNDPEIRAHKMKWQDPIWREEFLKPTRNHRLTHDTQGRRQD